jgi:amino acid transporter
VCSAAFGGLLQTKTPEFDRKRLTLIALAVVGGFLLVVAALVFVTTKAPKGGGTSSRVEQVGPDGGPGQSGQTGPQAPAGEIANL